MSTATDNNASAELDLQALIRRAEAQTDFPEVPLDEFTPPTYDAWKEACIALLKGAPFEKKLFTKTYEGITFSPMYFHGDTEPIQPKTYPGMGDYVRGITPNGYVNAPWGIAQACDDTLPEENNELLKHEIDKGSTIYNVKVDCATRKARDARECEHIGKHGCSVTTLGDAETLLKGLKLDQYPLYVYAGESALPLLALIVAAVKNQGGDVAKLKGIIGANPIAEYVANGTLNQSLDKLYDEAAAVAKWAVDNAPNVRTIFVKSNVFSNGGANDVQEVAYTVATGVAYLRALLERGLTIEQAASQIMFGFSMGANFFMQIAKLRAVRPIWAQIVKAFGGSEDAQKMHIHGRPAKFFKTVYDPYVNMLRDTTELSAAWSAASTASRTPRSMSPSARATNSAAALPATCKLSCKRNSGFCNRLTPPAAVGLSKRSPSKFAKKFGLNSKPSNPRAVSSPRSRKVIRRNKLPQFLPHVSRLPRRAKIALSATTCTRT